MVAVCVSFKVIAEDLDLFLMLMQKNAELSLLEEPGCLQFDVCSDQQLPNEIFLYEIYTSLEAFEQHLKTDHFEYFDAMVSELTESKHVKIYDVVK